MNRRLLRTALQTLGISAFALLSVHTRAHGQEQADSASAEASDPNANASAHSRRAAAAAYDRGSAAWLAQDYAHAARWFETAHRLAPAPIAVAQAVRSHERAGNMVRAATLALYLREQFPQHTGVAAPVLREAGRTLVRVDVSCERCALDVDGKLQELHAFFVSPNDRHTIIASFTTGDVRQILTGEPGDALSFRFDAPPEQFAEPARPTTDNVVEDATPVTTQPAIASTQRVDILPPVAAPAEKRNGLPRGVAIALMGASAGLAGVAVWSGLDTLSGVDAYEASPTVSALEAGQRKERRTNALIGSAGALAAATVVIAAFATDWSGSSESEQPGLSAGAMVTPDGAAATLTGRF